MNINKRTSKPRKVKSGKRVAIIFNVVEWLLYIVFSVLAALFVKDVWVQFQAKDTFMGQSLEPMTEFPSIVFCLDKYSWNYRDGIIKIQATLDNGYNTLKENETRFGLDGKSVVLHQVSNQCF